MEQIVVNEIQDVFGVDALESSHPISVQVNDPNEINELFDSISYAKGSLYRSSSFRKTFSEGFQTTNDILARRRFHYPDVEQIFGRQHIPHWFD